MKVGIVTITGSSNYGNFLQNYAVEHTLKKIGAHVQTLKTDCVPENKVLSKKWIKIVVKEILRYGSYSRDYRVLRFSKFCDKYLERSEETYFETFPQKKKMNFDFLCFGSDQIWNFTWGGRLCKGINFYTGGFSPDIPKIAFSASIGADYIPKEYQQNFIRNVSKFKAISVREEKAKEIIYNLMGNEVAVTVDPTLLLDKSEWLEISEKPHYVRKQDKFILTYFLGDLDDEIQKFINNIAEQNGLKIINLSNEWLPQNQIKNPSHFITDPSEFVWLIANCEMMFTDSFHGCVFSILMDKPFRCFDRVENDVESMSSRMETLFSKFGISDWCRGDVNEPAGSIFYKDYSNVQNVLKKERGFALDYLKGALDINEA